METPIHRLPQLDGLRGLAAVGVAFGFHATFMLASAGVQLDGSGPVVAWFRTWGWSFVDLFFVLSGYVFAHVYLTNDTLRTGKGIRQFAIARFARLYPLHLALLLLTAAMFHADPANTPIAFAAHLTMLQAFAEPVGQTFVGPSWSLSVEMVCYALFALAAFFARGRALAVVTGCMLLGAVLLFLFEYVSLWSIGGRLTRGILGFFMGVALWKLRGPLAHIPTLFLAIMLPAGVLASAYLYQFLPIALLAWPAALLFSLRIPLMGAKPLTWLGDRSYAIYLIHIPLIDLAGIFLGKFGDSGGAALLVYAGLIGLTLLCSDMAYRRLELPARLYLRGAGKPRGDVSAEPA